MLRSAYITGIRLSLKLSIRWPYAILPKGFGDFDKTGNARMKTWSPPSLVILFVFSPTFGIRGNRSILGLE